MKRIFILGSINTDFVISTNRIPQAGDMFCGGLVAHLSNGYSLEESVIFGSKMATIACTKQGTQPSIPYIKK